MSGMYEIVGFDEIVGGSFPPHSTQGYHRRHHHHHAGLNVQDLISGAGPSIDEYAGDLIAGDFGTGELIAGMDPAEQLLAIAGLGNPGLTHPPAVPMATHPSHPHHPGHHQFMNNLRQAYMRGFQPRTIDVRTREARAPRRLVLNFRQLGVQPGLAVDLPARPQLPFRPERLFVQSDIAGNFELIDIIVGNRSQFAQATPMSARIAAETSFGFDLHMDTAMVAMDVTLRIANITGAASDFRATIVGTSAIP